MKKAKHVNHVLASRGNTYTEIGKWESKVAINRRKQWNHCCSNRYVYNASMHSLFITPRTNRGCDYSQVMGVCGFIDYRKKTEHQRYDVLMRQYIKKKKKMFIETSDAIHTYVWIITPCKSDSKIPNQNRSLLILSINSQSMFVRWRILHHITVHTYTLVKYKMHLMK